MNEEEKEEIELDIEAKYVDKTEKEFLSRVTYAECIYILTPENKYCDKIKELSVLKICEIIKNLQKENEELKADNYELNNRITDLLENIPVQKVKDKIRKNEEIIDISNDGDLIHELCQKNKVYEELLEEMKEGEEND